MHNPTSVLENYTSKLLWDFDIQTDFITINKNKRTCKIVDFAILADHRLKLKESQKKDKYQDLNRELKKQTNKLWNMKVKFIPIVIGALVVTKGFLKGLEDLEIRGRVVTI